VAVAKGIWRLWRALPDILAAHTSALSPRMFRTIEARTLLVQAARVVLLKRTWGERHGLKPWIEPPHFVFCPDMHGGRLSLL
jgi:hypothetical protein